MSLTAKHKNINAVRAEVGMVFQQFNLFPHLTVSGKSHPCQTQVPSATKQGARKLRTTFCKKCAFPKKRTTIRHSFRADSSSGLPLRGRSR